MNTLDIRLKVFGDAVHGDIWLSDLEVAIVDTPDFQRLRRIQQLGTTSLIYPTADHSRFTHSLGTVLMAQRMMDAMDSGVDGQEILSDPARRTIRLCALLHDIGHVPFGHTIEDETRLFVGDDKHDSHATYERFLSAGRPIGQLIADNVSENERRIIIDTLSAKDEAAIRNLEFPFAADIVGNTLCADLLDYLIRDVQACGLEGRYHRRILDYLTLVKHEGVVRLALRLHKGRDVRRDVISEFVGLLQRRYELAERVYYHHTKMLTSGMVSEAIQAALRSTEDPESEFSDRRFLEQHGDQSLLHWLASVCSDPIANRLGEALLTRTKYKPVFKLSWRERHIDGEEASRVEGWAERYNEDSNARWQMERTLEAYNELPAGSVVIYCPSRKMQRKVAQALVIWKEGSGGEKPSIVQFCEIPDPVYREKVEALLNDHERLWKAYVMVDSRVATPEIIRCLASDCEREFDLMNEFSGLRNLAEPAPIQRRLAEWDARTGQGVTLQEGRSLAEILRFPAPGEEGRDPPTDKELEDALMALRKKRLPFEESSE